MQTNGTHSPTAKIPADVDLAWIALSDDRPTTFPRTQDARSQVAKTFVPTMREEDAVLVFPRLEHGHVLQITPDPASLTGTEDVDIVARDMPGMDAMAFDLDATNLRVPAWLAPDIVRILAQASGCALSDIGHGLFRLERKPPRRH